MLSAVGNVVHQIQEVTGIGKSDSDKQKDQQDVQQELDQAPAGVDDDESTPEFTTTKKETQPDGESVVKETQDDVPLPQDDTAELPPAETQTEASTTTDAEPATDDLPAAEPMPKPESTEDLDTTPQPTETQSKPQSKPQAKSQEAQPASTAAAADSVYVPSDKPFNQMRNMGGGSTAQPKTSKKWKTQPGSWFPDASGVQYAPGFFINKRRYPSWQ